MGVALAIGGAVALVVVLYLLLRSDPADALPLADEADSTAAASSSSRPRFTTTMNLSV